MTGATDLQLPEELRDPVYKHLGILREGFEKRHYGGRVGFGERPAFEALIAEVDGHCAGVCVFFASFSTYRGEPGAYVQDLFVEPAMRGSGIGARLLQRLAAVTRERGGGYIRLSVDVRNAAAHAFYTRLGVKKSRGEQIHAAYDEDFNALADADRDG